MKSIVCFTSMILTLAGFCPVASSQAQRQIGPQVVYPIYFDTSLPVRQYPSALPAVGPGLRVRPLPRRVLPTTAIPQSDLVEQLAPSAVVPLAAVSAAISRNFDGIADSANGSLRGVPPDENLAVGSTQVVEVINTSYQVFSKSTGGSVQSPRQISSIFTGVGGLCGQGTSSPNFTDPIVLYDKAAGRWFVAVVAGNNNFSTGNECIAVSSTPDATGTYHRYVFSFGTNVFNDYDKFGVWRDAYYGAVNLFSPTAFLGARACAYQRSAMLAGGSAKAICFTSSREFSLLPSDLDGATAPPSGEPNFFLGLFSTTALHFFKFHVDFTTPSNSKFTGPTAIAVSGFTQACSANGICIPQTGTTTQLDSLGDRLMFRLAYRNLGGHESLVVNHAVKTSVAPAGIRWYEIRSPNATPVVFQQGTLTNGSTSLWMGSIGMDKVGDLALGFSESSSSIHPGIAFTGRTPSDPLNTMEGITAIFNGTGSQTGSTANGGDRWGDYSGLAIDPSSDCIFWYVNEYIPSNGNFNFHTRIASFKFPNCT